MARRRGIGQASDYIAEFTPRKGLEVEAQIGTNGKFRRAAIVKAPKHGRWFHVYDDVEKRLVKKVPTGLIRQRSSDDNRPDDLEME
jgi:hypothetical protein